MNQILLIIEQTHEEGYPLKEFLWDILDFVKNAYLIKTGVIKQEDSLLSESDYKALSQEAQLWDQEILNQTFHDFYDLYSNVSIFNMASSNEMRISLEMAIVSIFQKLQLPSVAQLTQKIVNLKNAIEQNYQKNQSTGNTSTQTPQTKNQKKTDEIKSKPDTNDDGADIDTIIQEGFMGNQDTSPEVSDIFTTP